MLKLFVFIPFLLFTFCQISHDQRNLRSTFRINGEKAIKDIYVFDDVGLLDEEQREVISVKLKNFYETSNIEILCILAKTYQPFDDGMEYGNFILSAYDEEEVKDVVLIIVFKEDRSLIIKTNKNSQKHYTDSECQKIVDEYMLPRFRSGNFFHGLNAGVNMLIKSK